MKRTYLIVIIKKKYSEINYWFNLQIMILEFDKAM
jgi:hypothetical protein